MATPPRIKEESPPPLVKRVSEQPYDICNSRKRNHNFFDESLDDGMWELNDDGRPKTRRVNPQRLAVRLGPELVAEMEALIVPGAKMPTFAVRKDFQERYQVDRRHIYDYFHSRGLRVAKEDKHTNLIRGRAMKAQAQAQLFHTSQVQAKVEENPDRDTPLNFSVSISHQPRGRTITKRKIKFEEKRSRIMRPATLPSAAPKSAKQLRESIFLGAQCVSGDASSESGPWTSSSGTDTDWESKLTCPQFTLPNDSSDNTTERSFLGSDFLRSPDEFVAGYFDSLMQPEVEESLLDIDGVITCESGLESFMSVDEHRLLTEDERTELYNLINNNIPSTSGLEESAGTYNTYMSEKTRSYFDRLLPVSRHPRTLRAGTRAYKSSTVCNSQDFLELRKWLSDDVDLYQPIHEFHPASGDLDDMSYALIETSGSIHLDSIPFQQFHNRAALGILIGTAEKVNKRVVKSSGERLENINPVSSQRQPEPSRSLSTSPGLFSNMAGQSFR